MPLPQGRVLGGSSSINGLVYNRGQREDYDEWAAFGNHGWSYTDVLPYFKRSEQYALGDATYRGRDGLLPVADGAVAGGRAARRVTEDGEADGAGDVALGADRQQLGDELRLGTEERQHDVAGVVAGIDHIRRTRAAGRRRAGRFMPPPSAR